MKFKFIVKENSVLQIVNICDTYLENKKSNYRKFDQLLLSSIPDVNDLLQKNDFHSNKELEDFIERSGIMMDGNNWDQEKADKEAFEQILLRRKIWN